MTNSDMLDQVRKHMDLTVYLTPEELPEHLRRYTFHSDDMAWFHHPMLVQFFPVALQAPIETMIAERMKVVMSYVREGDFCAALSYVERAYRLPHLMTWFREGYFDTSSARDAIKFWQVAAKYWTDAEFDENDPIWSQIMEADIPFRDAMTRSKARKKFAQLPSEITVYRGVQSPTKEQAADDATAGGWSWTLSRKTAEFFAKRWLKARMKRDGIHGFVAEHVVPKEIILAYLDIRGEEEVLIEPNSIGPEDVTISWVAAT